MVVAHQAQRKNITDQLVLEYMKPRPLNMTTGKQITCSKGITKLEPFLNKDSLDQLESRLASQSYIHGYQFSDVDVIVASHINALPSTNSYVHVNRWLSHVTNQEDKPECLPKNVKSDILLHFGSDRSIFLRFMHKFVKRNIFFTHIFFSRITLKGSY